MGATLLAFSAPFLPMPMFGLVAIPVAFLAWALGGSGVLLLAVGKKWHSVALAGLAWCVAGVCCVMSVGMAAEDLLHASRAGTDPATGFLVGTAVGMALVSGAVAAIAGFLAAGPVRAVATGLVGAAPVALATVFLIELVEYGLPLSA